MPHTYSNLLYHVVFSTKERFPFITSELEPRLYDYMGGTVRGLDGIQLEIGGVNDHVHLLIKLKPTIKLSDFMREMKSSTSKWANEITNGRFEWQDGYGAFTVGRSEIETVRHYIQNQKLHHRRMDFREEFLGMLVENEMEFDEKYLWT